MKFKNQNQQIAKQKTTPPKNAGHSDILKETLKSWTLN